MAGTSTGLNLARQVIKRRDAMPQHRFSEIQQVQQIPGLDTASVKNLVDKFQPSQADLFRENMYAHVLPANWKLTHFTSFINDRNDFIRTADTKSYLLDHISREVSRISFSHTRQQTVALMASLLAENAYLERYEMAHTASFALALWFYRFDADNWFSFEAVRQQAEDYLNHATSNCDRKVLCLLKGFNNHLAFDNAETVDDLPVVLDYAEQTVSIWTCSLVD